MEMNMKVGIIGYGYVGKAMAKFYENHCDVFVYDPALENNADHNLEIKFVSKDVINACDVGVICVPTPVADDGSCNVQIVEETVKWLNTPLILIKSTISVGTTDRLRSETGKRIVFSPEYCGESSYWTPYKFHTDVKETPFFIFGGNPEDTSKFVDMYMKIVGPTKVYRQTTAKCAEMAKYMENTFYALKIMFCYEINEICHHLRVDYNEARELWLLDPRINPMHTAVFADNIAPFGGKCLPKDTSALIKTAEDFGYTPALLKEVMSSNARIGKQRKLRKSK